LPARAELEKGRLAAMVIKKAAKKRMTLMGDRKFAIKNLAN
jgi:hypothetical protein